MGTSLFRESAFLPARLPLLGEKLPTDLPVAHVTAITSQTCHILWGRKLLERKGSTVDVKASLRISSEHCWRQDIKAKGWKPLLASYSLPFGVEKIECVCLRVIDSLYSILID